MEETLLQACSSTSSIRSNAMGRSHSSTTQRLADWAFWHSSTYLLYTTTSNSSPIKWQSRFLAYRLTPICSIYRNLFPRLLNEMHSYSRQTAHSTLVSGNSFVRRTFRRPACYLSFVRSRALLLICTTTALFIVIFTRLAFTGTMENQFSTWSDFPTTIWSYWKEKVLPAISLSQLLSSSPSRLLSRIMHKWLPLLTFGR